MIDLPYPRILGLALFFAAFQLHAQEAMPPPQIAASPSRVELEIGERPVNDSVKLFNLGDKPVKVHVSVVNWELDENNRVQEIPPDEQSMDQWMLVNPLRFSIPSGGSQAVRFSIRPRTEPDPGEHRAMIFFEQAPDDQTPAGAIQVRFRLGIAVYGLAGEIRREGRLHDLDLRLGADRAELGFDLENLGNASVRLDGTAALWSEADFPRPDAAPLYDPLQKDGLPAGLHRVLKLPSTPVLPGTRRTVRMQMPLPSEKGDYRLHIRGALGEEPLEQVLRIQH